VSDTEIIVRLADASDAPVGQHLVVGWPLYGSATATVHGMAWPALLPAPTGNEGYRYAMNGTRGRVSSVRPVVVDGRRMFCISLAPNGEPVDDDDR
jgi:hypothetical protein